MATRPQWDLSTIEQRVCSIASSVLSIPRERIDSSSRLIKDLNCDSLALVELLMELEAEFDVTLSPDTTDPIGKSIFTRQPFRLRDLAEVVSVQQGSGKPESRGWKRRPTVTRREFVPFSQLSGRLNQASLPVEGTWFDPLETVNGIHQFRRRSDGMRCLLLPGGSTTIGSDAAHVQADERPAHQVVLDAFAIDAEPVSTTAYCRFLNSVTASEADWKDWFLLAPTDPRTGHTLIQESLYDGWQPVAGAEFLPMVLVSWLGANAYSLWANRSDWRRYDELPGFLPSEAQWEYAAHGADLSAASNDRTLDFVAGQHEHRATYEAATMPMAAVHLPLGCSTFGLHHMAGNVWQWCRDWYAPDFYHDSTSRRENPVNTTETGLRSERGGSWVGPADLCRTTSRRGRIPNARGRCLGFRCISPTELLPE